MPEGLIFNILRKILFVKFLKELITFTISKKKSCFRQKKKSFFAKIFTKIFLTKKKVFKKCRGEGETTSPVTKTIFKTKSSGIFDLIYLRIVIS